MARLVSLIMRHMKLLRALILIHRLRLELGLILHSAACEVHARLLWLILTLK